MKRAPKTSGFSLLELVVVISIIALLAGVVTPRVSGRLAMARDARRLADIKAVRDAIEQYREDTGAYPAANTNGSYGGWDVSHDGNFISILVDSGYLREFVQDPINDNTHHYRYYLYNQGSYNCVGPGPFYVLGVRNFETTDFAAKNVGLFSCTGRDWGTEFDWVCGGGASRL